MKKIPRLITIEVALGTRVQTPTGEVSLLKFLRKDPWALGPWSARTATGLQQAAVDTIAQLVGKTEEELKYRNRGQLGKTSFREIVRNLSAVGLSLGMCLDPVVERLVTAKDCDFETVVREIGHESHRLQARLTGMGVTRSKTSEVDPDIVAAKEIGHAYVRL